MTPKDLKEEFEDAKGAMKNGQSGDTVLYWKHEDRAKKQKSKKQIHHCTGSNCHISTNFIS
jgi:hypothetical protein